MKKPTIILISILIVIGAVFFLMKKPGGSPMSGDASAQEQTIEILGSPSHFSIQYLPQGDAGDALIRYETWLYPDIGKKIVFIGGNIAYTDVLDPNIVPKAASGISPEKFHYEMTVEEINNELGETAEEVDFLPGISQDEGVVVYVSKKAIFATENGKLSYFQTLGLIEPASSPVGSIGLKSDTDYSLIQTAEAKNIFRCIGKVCRFVVTAPDRLTRRLGPVLGPIASAIITKNILGNAEIGRVFRDAQRIDKVIKSVEEQKKLVNELRRAYGDQANEMRNQAELLKKEKEALGQRLISGAMSFDEYKASVVDVQAMINSLESGAEKLARQGERVNEGTILAMLGRDVLRQMARQAEGIIFTELQNELRRIVNIDVVTNILSQNDRGSDAVLDLLISGELRGLLAGSSGGFDADELKRRVRDELKLMIKNNKNDLRANWKQKVTDLIKRIKQDLEKQNPTPSAIDIKGTICEQKGEVISEQCKPGYEFQRMSGVGCVQKKCNEIPDAHWSYEGYCVCGSSGSMFENVNDPNKECYMPSNCGPCPGCVYACVHFDEKCPSLPK